MRRLLLRLPGCRPRAPSTPAPVSSRAVHAAAAEGFGRAAAAYEAYRPEFDPVAVEWLLGGAVGETTLDAQGRHRSTGEHAGAAVRHDVLDLGAGTGKLSRAVLDARPGLRMVGVDPVNAMCEQYAAALGGRATVLQGAADNIPLLDSSVASALVGQAFHWFATEAALREIHRVVAPGGGLGLIWTIRDTSVDWVRALDDDIIAPLYGDDVPRQQTHAWREVFDQASSSELSD